MANFAFDATGVEVSEFMAIPAGWYAAEITDSELKDTKSGSGKYLQLTIRIIEGEHTGRLMFERLNLINPNQTAVQIAQQTLAGICKAIGIDSFEQTEELHGKPFKLGIKAVDDAEYGDANGKKNEINGYSAIGKPGEQKAPGKADKKPSSDRPW